MLTPGTKIGPYEVLEVAGTGKELFYVSDDSAVLAVPLTVSGDELKAGEPTRLFTVPAGSQVDVSRDGSKFLVNGPVETDRGTPLTVVVNWRVSPP